MMATIDDLRGLGYDAGVAFEGDGFTVYRVHGFGVSMQVRDDDQAALTQISNGHRELATQESESVQQTRRRWVRERRIEPPNVRDVT